MGILFLLFAVFFLVLPLVLGQEKLGNVFVVFIVCSLDIPSLISITLLEEDGNSSSLSFNKIISLVNKINKRSTDIFAMIAGALMLIIGILILCLATDETINVLWLIIGILLLIYSIFALVAALKKDKNVVNEDPKEIN